MNLNTPLVQTHKALVSSIGDELVMFDADAGQYYGLNQVATAIWNHLETKQGKTIAELAEILCTEFDISKENCQEELLHFIPELMDKGLITTMD